MKRFIVDASVGVKWLVPSVGEPFAAEAETLLDSYARGEIRLFVPDFFWVEIGNVLWKTVIRGRMMHRDAEGALDRALGFAFQAIPAFDLLPVAFPMALGQQRTVYDSLYVAAAVSARAELVTADEKLVNALGTRFPVRWLGGLQSFL